jgi:hypothetical protein
MEIEQRLQYRILERRLSQLHHIMTNPLMSASLPVPFTCQASLAPQQPSLYFLCRVKRPLDPAHCTIHQQPFRRAPVRVYHIQTPPNLASRCTKMERNDLSPLEPKENLDPIEGLLRDRARRFRPANERPPSPTFDEFRLEAPHAYAWYTQKMSESEGYKKSCEGMDDFLKEAEDSIRAAQQFLEPDLRREPEILLEDTGPRSRSLEETYLWMEEMQKRLNEQDCATQAAIASDVGAGQPLPMRQSTTQSATFRIWPIFRIAASSERRTWSVGLRRRIG